VYQARGGSTMAQALRTQREPRLPRKCPAGTGAGGSQQQRITHLVSTLQVLADGVKLYGNNPARLHDVIDRLAFRICETEDLFQFCHGPTVADLPVGGGTIWGLICETPSVPAGVLIKRFLVERLGDEFVLEERYQDAVIFAIDEHSENLALFEIISRCPGLRKAYACRENALSCMVRRLEQLRHMCLCTSKANLDTDRSLVGTTSGVYGVRDSDAFFGQVDLFRSLLELLLSPECAETFARQGASAPADLRSVCSLVVEISGHLHVHPRVLTRALAFLSSAVPLAFRLEDATGDMELMTFADMLLTGHCLVFLEEVVQLCAGNRMYDSDDLRDAYSSLFGQGRPEDDRRRGRTAQGDVRLLVCHTVLLLFHLLALLPELGDSKDRPGRPSRFVRRLAGLLRDRFLQPLRKALDGRLATIWRPARDSFCALVTGVAKAPLPLEELQWLFTARSAWRAFASQHFLQNDNTLLVGDVDSALDALGNASVETRVTVDRLLLLDRSDALLPAKPDRPCQQVSPPEPLSHMKNNRTLELRYLRLLDQIGQRPVPSRDVLGVDAEVRVAGTPRGRSHPASPRAPLLSDRGASLVSGKNSLNASLPLPLPAGSSARWAGSGQLGSRWTVGQSSRLARSALPPLAAGVSARGCFYHVATAEYIA